MAALCDRGEFAAARDLADSLLAAAPRHPALLSERSGIALALGDVEGAIAFMRRAVAASRRARYLGRLAGLLLRHGGAEEARRLLTEAIGTRTDQAQLLGKLGTASRMVGDHAGAYAAFAKARAAGLDNPRFHLAFGDAALRVGAIEDAAAAYSRIAVADSRRPKAEMGLARCANRRGDRRSEVRHLAQVLLADPHDARVALALVTTALAADRWADAFLAIDGHLAVVDRPAPKLLGRTVDLARSSGDTRRERDALERLVLQQPTSVRRWIELGRATRKLDGSDAEWAVLDRAECAMGPQPRVTLRRVGLLLDKGRIAEAERAMEMAAATFGDHGRVVATLARHHLRCGRLAEADDVTARLACLPDTAVAVETLAAQRAESLGDIATAAAALVRAIAASVKPASAQAGLARLALRRVDEGAARSHLAAAREAQAATGERRVSHHVLVELDNELRIHAGAGARARVAVEAEDVAELAAILRQEPGSTVLAAALLSLLHGTGRLGETVTSVGEPTITRRISQFWNSASPPPDVMELMASWQGANPDWTYQLHDERSGRAYLDALGHRDLLRAWRLARLPAQKADLLRLALLSEQGGIYADADDRCLGALDGLVGSATLIVGQEPYGSAGNNFIAASPGHPVIVAALDDAVRAMIDGGAESIWLRTGPGAITRALALHLAGDAPGFAELDGRILILPRHALSRYVWVHCQPDYKVQGRTWQRAELRV